MKKKIRSLKEMFANDKEFFEALDDVFIMEKLKTPTKYSEEADSIEEKLIELIPKEIKPAFDVLLTNYKRYLHKHFIEYLKEEEKKVFHKSLCFGKLLAQNKKDK